MTTFVDIHVLQTVPPSNVNRDDTGSPKTAVYGGVRRARVSSQSWKRASRNAFSADLDSSDLGVRTRRVVTLVADRISTLAPELEDTAMDLATEVLKATGLTIVAPKKKAAEEAPGEPTSGFLVFLSQHQVDQLAALAVESARSGTALDKKAVKQAADTRHSLDIALFGRMIADDKALNVDASAQVAHALSVHGVDNEFDYYTAVDDRSGESDAGAGMIGTVEFNSSTLYRYATVDVEALAANLGLGASDVDATARAVTTFVRAFALSMPTGKQNTFANRTMPDAVVVAVRSGQPVNLVGAFESAVTAEDGFSRLAVAARRLSTYSAEVDAAFGSAAECTFVVRVSEACEPLDRLGERVSMPELLDALPAALRAEPAPVPA